MVPFWSVTWYLSRPTLDGAQMWPESVPSGGGDPPLRDVSPARHRISSLGLEFDSGAAVPLPIPSPSPVALSPNFGIFSQIDKFWGTELRSHDVTLEIMKGFRRRTPLYWRKTMTSIEGRHIVIN